MNAYFFLQTTNTFEFQFFPLGFNPTVTIFGQQSQSRDYSIQNNSVFV